MISIKVEQTERLQNLFENTPKEIPKIISRALNRSATFARTASARKVRQTYRVKHAQVIGSIKIKKAYPGDLVAELRSEDSPIPLTGFQASKNRKGYRVSVKRGTGKQINHAFLLTPSKFGDSNISIRKTANRTPTQGLFGPSIPQMIGNENIIDGVVDEATEMLGKRMEHEISRLLT